MPVGKRVRGALYVHHTAIHDVDGAAAQRMNTVLRAAPDVHWNVVRFEEAAVGLLDYADFEEDPFPALRASTRVTFDPYKMVGRDFSRSANPLILHRKELLVAESHPQRETWAALTAALEQRGLFHGSHLIGRRQEWFARLAAAGVRIDGHKLCPI